MQLLGGLAVITVVVAAVFYLTFPAYKHRYRMTVEIEADGNPHTGSGVVDVSHHYHGPFAGLLAGRYDSSFSGDAPVVDLGKYGIVLAVPILLGCACASTSSYGYASLRLSSFASVLAAAVLTRNPGVQS